MIHRKLYTTVERALNANSAVVLTGARQVGKTTLARAIGEGSGAVYVDLERPSDAAKLSDVESYCNLHAGRLVILDEVQRLPNLFATLRSIIDERRRAGKRYRQFLLLGSASIDLLRQSSETLAGRIAECELCPFGVDETGAANVLWLRGGFPESFLAADDERSLDWRLAAMWASAWSKRPRSMCATAAFATPCWASAQPMPCWATRWWAAAGKAS